MTADAAKFFGPPGTGKTYSGIEWMAEQVRQGADADGLAFISFTRAACEEAKRRLSARLGLFDYELSYCATIHALCYRALGIESGTKILEGKALKEFAESYDYDLLASRKSATEDLDEVAQTRGADAPYLEVWGFGRNRLIRDPEAAWEAFERYDPVACERLSYAKFLQFVADYESYKQLCFRLDYTDLLLRVIDADRSLPLSVVAVDEAQDMTPALWAAADVLCGGAPVRACLADDDQTIYSFQGATPELFLGRAAGAVYQLRQSRRLPSRVLDVAASIIGQNRTRQRKLLSPVTPEIVEARADREPGPAREIELHGHVQRLVGFDRLDLTNGERWMLLVRNWAFVEEIVRSLESDGIPYLVQGDAYYSPWQEKGPLKAVRAVYALSEGERLRLADLAPLVDKTRTETKGTSGAWVHGAKTRLAERMQDEPQGAVTLLDLPHLGLTEWGFDRIVQRDLSLLSAGVSGRDLEAYQAAQRRGTWGQPPRVVVSSIHGVKGQEADNVAVLAACTQAPLRNLDREDRREEEHRLAYVAVTRARKRLFVVDPRGGFGCPWDVFGALN